MNLKLNNSDCRVWERYQSVPLSERRVSADSFLSVSLTETEFADRVLPVSPENQADPDRMSGGEKGQSSANC